MKIPYSYKKYYVPCIVSDNIGTVECYVAKDGLMFIFDYNDIKELLLNYPKDKDGWYFNNTRDRYIAEKLGDELIIVNPQFVYEHFKEIIT